jgi:uncharacterized protein YbjT (DUF2867 family)
VPALTVRPVSTADVAAALADAVEAGPSGRLPVIAGPAAVRLPDMVRALLRRRGERVLVVPLPVPGRATALVPAPGEPCRHGERTFAAWLGEQEPVSHPR